MNVSLLNGWFPAVMKLLALSALVASIGWRGRFWRLRRLPIAVGISIVLTLLATLAVIYLADIQDAVPVGMWFWMGVGILALTVLVVGWQGARWWHRAAVPVAVLFGFVTAANALNVATGYYPTVQDAFGELSDQPLPQQITLEQARSITGASTTGRLVTVTIPTDRSGFKAREELVYLPPAWFRSKHRPELPVLEMIGGQYTTPTNWVRAGKAVEIADAYAAKHDGYAPILVMADATGNFRTDTECVNGTHGKPEDHLVKDIPPFMKENFGTAGESRKWGVVGWSMGGTCAITLTVTHPDVFSHFVDISGDLGPTVGTKEETISQLYGGDAKAWAAHDPLTVMAARKGKYHGVSGYLAAGTDESKHINQAKQLEEAAQTAGIFTKLSIDQPGKHDWQFGAAAFERALPWISQQLGTPSGSSSSSSPSSSPSH